jgi:hypothetical protein
MQLVVWFGLGRTLRISNYSQWQGAAVESCGRAWENPKNRIPECMFHSVPGARADGLLYTETTPGFTSCWFGESRRAMLRHRKQIAYDCALGVDWSQTAKAKSLSRQ